MSNVGAKRQIPGAQGGGWESVSEPPCSRPTARSFFFLFVRAVLSVRRPLIRSRASVEMIGAAWRWLARLALCNLPVCAAARAALADYQGQRPESAALSPRVKAKVPCV